MQGPGANGWIPGTLTPAPDPSGNLAQGFWGGFPGALTVGRYFGNSGWDLFTPWKINMEPTNHPFRKENDLPNLHDYVPC